MATCSPPAPMTTPSVSGTRPPDNRSTLFLDIPIGSLAWRGRPMAACSPPVPLTTPFASGMQVQDDKHACLKPIQAILLPYLSRQIAASLHRNLGMERFGSGTLMLGKQ